MVKQRPPKANSVFPLSFFFNCSVCSPKQRDNTPICSTPAARPLHNNFHCCLQLPVDCSVCSPNVILMKPSTSSNTLLHVGQFLLFSLCTTMPVSCLLVPLPVFLPLPLVICPEWLLHCRLRLSLCHLAGNDTPIGLTGDGGACACSDNFFRVNCQITHPHYLCIFICRYQKLYYYCTLTSASTLIFLTIWPPICLFFIKSHTWWYVTAY
jgi:hypothetical protein